MSWLSKHIHLIFVVVESWTKCRGITTGHYNAREMCLPQLLHSSSVSWSTYHLCVISPTLCWYICLLWRWNGAIYRKAGIALQQMCAVHSPCAGRWRHEAQPNVYLSSWALTHPQLFDESWKHLNQGYTRSSSKFKGWFSPSPWDHLKHVGYPLHVIGDMTGPKSLSCLRNEVIFFVLSLNNLL